MEFAFTLGIIVFSLLSAVFWFSSSSVYVVDKNRKLLLKLFGDPKNGMFYDSRDKSAHPYFTWASGRLSGIAAVFAGLAALCAAFKEVV